jgi:hypothetical protein
MIPAIVRFFRPKRPKPREHIFTHQGEIFDLKEIFHSINERYFENQLDLPIGWFGNRKSKARTVIRLGSYNLHSRVIKIHRLLDQAHIPKYFVSYIVYHEMLHHVLPPVKERRGRRNIHHLEFKKREKLFRDYLLAQEFSKNLRKTLFISPL